MTETSAPRFIRVGPIAARRFDERGRLEIPLDGVEQGSWVGTPIERLVSRAAALALVVDVLDPAVDAQVGAEHRFILNSRIDGRIDTRTGNPPPERQAYGALVDVPLDLDLLDRHAVLVHDRVPGGPANDAMSLRYPRVGRLVEQLGPGVTWYPDGERDYFDQLLSFAGAVTGRDRREGDRRARLWDKQLERWQRKSSDAERALEGPWT
ncbi:hypothetical protein Csp2054_06810 [Curtobacterium sp. 'Ferrero']|uniref:hypothetical protein n=1 Tax=Curtobacterium sp. 'Ferrero' TaxID=2033654 RepID=UPI000BCB7424|nr:hypothetical protein [Curtobacterium sp. 'Ferrero']PCN48415.1 hypothetical protein Csp2054_06810 [Curtobacterium sp. 'Ferrero']